MFLYLNINILKCLVFITKYLNIYSLYFRHPQKIVKFLKLRYTNHISIFIMTIFTINENRYIIKIYDIYILHII